MFNKHKKLTARLKRLFLAHEFQGGYILNIQKNQHHMILQLQLPPAREVSDLEVLLDNLKQETGYEDAKIIETTNKRVTVAFGSIPDEILFNNKYLHPNTLKIELPSAFGSQIIDFEDGASCHMLNGGAPRMGKTLFLLYLSSILYHQNNGNIKLFITSTKSKDFYPLLNLPNVTVSEQEEDFILALHEVINEYKTRNSLLHNPSLAKATDSKSVKSLYPSHYYLFSPIFFIIDEYARFSDKKIIQQMVAELVQTAGYVNVHVIISTQRPDARQTLPANIKMGLMCRICFRTADKNNSIVILDEEGAEHLPNVKGRAILRDGEKSMVQVPLLTYEKCEELLNPYKKETITHETPNHKETERSENTPLTNKIQNLFEESVSETNLFTEQQPDQHHKQSDETINNGWFRLTGKTDKR